jgi:pilus assembly protein CpaB
MDSRRILTALFLAIILAGGLTYLVYSRLQRNAAHPQVTHIVAAAKSLPEGVALTPADVTLVDWPVSVPLPGSYSRIQQVVGKPLIYPLGGKEPVLERDLGVEGSGIGLSVKIPQGMRATSVRTNEITGVAGFLFPGSHVDVLATFNPPGSNGAVTQTILQNVQVLTAGEKIEPDPQGRPQTVDVVTLLLNSQDSQKLLLASTQGSIQFVLRNGRDERDAKVQPTNLAELATGQAAPPPRTKAVRRRVVHHAAPPPPNVYILEVIKGDQREVAKF